MFDRENIFEIDFYSSVKFYPYRTAQVYDLFFVMNRETDTGKEFEKKLRYWEKEYNNFPMKPLGWKSPNEQLKEYKLKKSA